MHSLTDLLHSTFGFPAFRANQEEVCRAATDGRDALLVMPTGAGKSLCYQLPALARGGTALVVSPLIALMEDQTGKLSALGLKVARIHSGLSREDARQACRDYLNGALNFLFIAPERMRVPGFPEMLARRKPSLIAIDEAHCISAWGHDFRPDYRTLGEHLPALRPAPIVALTATATPAVQRDIVAQLHLDKPALFIHGFRRSNLAIEVVEMSRPRRNEFTATLLKDAANRPAIVYAPSRKAAEELAGELGRRFPTAAYHAGLEASVRERVQAAFLSDKLDVVVATIAFGMGIDKANVRTVVHTALPASVEAYYQEIGRAGRDGLPSRTVLLHSYQDRKMHEFFLDLTRIAGVLTEDYLMPEPLAQRLKMDPYQFQKGVEKLVAQGAAATDMAGNVRRVDTGSAAAAWQTGYEAQIEFRRTQLDRIAAFAETQQCRMTALIQHFGDTADGQRPCGHCDYCAPGSTTAQTFLPATVEDHRQFAAILRELDGQSRSTGKLYTVLAAGALRGTVAAKDRKQFDVLLDALARASLLSIATDTFTNPEGNVINYKKASLTHEGREAVLSGDLAPYGLLVRAEDMPQAARGGRARSLPPAKPREKKDRQQAAATYTPDQQRLDDALRAWRKAEAAKTGKPAFMVLGDAVVRNLALACPLTIPELLTVSGIGPDKADRYGAEIVAICREPGTAPADPPTAAKRRAAVARESASSATEPRSIQPPVKGRTRPVQSFGKPTPTYTRVRSTESDSTATLTPDQEALDVRLRDWRKAEAEKIGLPQFFVLGASALRSIVLLQPRSVEQLRTINGIGPDKLERFAQGILAACNG